MTFKTEKESIDYVVERLSRMGWEEIKATQMTDPMCFYDIEAIYRQKKIHCLFELKRRNFESTKYGDCIIEYSKYVKMIEELHNGKVNKCILITLFSDVIAMSDITKPKRFEVKRCKHTTEFTDSNIIDKLMVVYDQHKIKQY